MVSQSHSHPTMPILVTCRCGAEYDLKDEFAGTLVQCPQCGASQRVTSALTPDSQADPLFARDIFLLRQKALAINEKYHVSDEHGQPLLFVERPRHVLRNLAATLVGALAGMLVWGALLVPIVALEALAKRNPVVEALSIVGVLVAMFAGVFAIYVVASLLGQKRHVSFYRDDRKTERVLEVQQDRKLHWVVQTFTVRDAEGQPLASLRKNWLRHIFRKQWKIHAPDGELLMVAKEDSIILSLLRRLGGIFALLRTNFVFVHRNGTTRLGEFKRKMTILDRYVLDLTPDRTRRLDRRVALALGVMLDTGERR